MHGQAGPDADDAFRVLCVDDEPNILNALRRLLRTEGYHVLTAGSGPEALALLEQTPVDVVISDMRMPEMDGVRLLAEVKTRAPETARILLTAHADVGATIAAINEGEIYRYIAKPWDDTLLLHIVGDAAERKRLRHERARLVKLTQSQNEALRDLNATLESKVRARTAELEDAHEKLKRSFITSIKVFSSLIELREGKSGGHSRRVAELARGIAAHMKLSDTEVQDVTIAGLLHEIGKLGFPDAWLHKPLNALTPDERAEFVKHPVRAQRALTALDELRGAGEFIRGQGERYDGLGFPDHLSGLAIPLGARILALTCDYDTARQGGAGRSPMSPARARDFILARRGMHYDPSVVDAFVEMLAARGAVGATDRSVTTEELRPNMVLNRDVFAKDGLLLLAKEQVLDDSLIAQIRLFEQTEGSRLVLYVRDAPASAGGVQRA
jgi:response regulator RpfG family c-di-GMP phosphodiesterase